MISIIITAYKEPNLVKKSIDSFLSQNIKEKYEIIAAAPDKETANVIKQYSKKYKQVTYFKDPGKGKMFALNSLIKKAKGNIIISTDGDVYVSNNSVNEILKSFKDRKVGCVTGKPVSINNKNNLFGYWSHLLTYGAHLERLRRVKKDKYITCSGYLFAFRNIIKNFPRDVPEDAYIPAIFYKKGYKIKYLPKAEVYVKYPLTFKEWIEQKKRIAKAYENYKRLKLPTMKSFFLEILYGTTKALSYPKTLKEFYWTLLLFFARFYMWLLTFFETSIKKEKHEDAWKRVETTK